MGLKRKPGNLSIRALESASVGVRAGADQLLEAIAETRRGAEPDLDGDPLD
jgi:hypothetical protein